LYLNFYRYELEKAKSIATKTDSVNSGIVASLIKERVQSELNDKSSKDTKEGTQ